jgi:hypothetical protein
MPVACTACIQYGEQVCCIARPTVFNGFLGMPQAFFDIVCFAHQSLIVMQRQICKRHLQIFNVLKHFGQLKIESRQ